jgi:hypothetical protein
LSSQFLVELSASDQHEQTVDLAGDAGAVGRLIIGQQGSAGNHGDRLNIETEDFSTNHSCK